MKKLLCLTLSMCMLLSGMQAFAIKYDANTSVPSGEETVLFSDDFESYTDGQALAVNNSSETMWTKQSNAATTKIAAVKDGDSMVMRFTNTNTEGTNAPRFEKHVNLTKLTNLSVSCRVKTVGTKLSFYAVMPDGQTSFLARDTGGEWISYKVVMDLKAKTFDVYVNGEPGSMGQEMKGGDFTEVQLRFSSTLSDGMEAMIDDIVFSTTDAVDASVLYAKAPVLTDAEILAPFDKTPAPVLSVPQGKYTMFTYDCSLNADNGIPTSSDVNFSKVSTKEYIKPAMLDKEKIIRATNLQEAIKTPRLEKALTLGVNPTTLTVEFYAQLSQSRVRLHILDAAGTDFASTDIGVKASGEAVWDLVKVTFDFKNKTVTVWCNDRQVEMLPFKAETTEVADVTVRIFPILQPKDTILMDNFIMYTDAAPDYGDVKYFGATGTNWEKIGTPLTPDSYMSNLRAHPRLFINDRQVILDKIANIAQCASWYTTVKQSADDLLNAENTKYVFDNGRNILQSARTIERRLMTLGFAYLVEQDRKYIDRGLEEIRNAGTFPDWSNSAPMIPSELMYGIACFYDWAYDGLAEDERLEIIEIVKRQALWQHVRSYDGVINVEITSGTTNRTMLANACAAGIAIAFADETPELSEFLFENALIYGKPPVEAFGTDGGFAEGVSYWGLATEFMVYLTAQCESAFVEGYEMPADLAWYYENPMIRNMADYWMYTAGPKYAFNYGDADTAPAADPTPYWLATRYEKPAYTWAMNQHTTERGRSVEYPYFAIIYYDADAPTGIDGVALDKTFDAKEDAQVATFRSSWTDENALYAAMQGGYNSASHMFKSLGTFVIDANGTRFIRTLGRSNYSALYDDSMYYLKRAEGQNTLIANPGAAWDQNPSATAKFIRHEEAENEAFSILDMTQTNEDFALAKRGMYITKGRNSIVLQDEVSMKKPSELWWFAHTDGHITLSADQKSALLTIGKERMYVAITQGPADATFRIMKALPLETSPVAPDEVYVDIFKLAIHMTNVTETTLTVEFVPLKDGEAAPESLTPVLPIDSWKVSDNAISTARQAGSQAVALLLNSPVVLDKGTRTYVDTANMDVYPFTENGRTLVPVRFISESFDAKVGWDDATQTVSVDKGNTSIRLQIGSDKMYINGIEKILDVPAQTYNSRTLIPLRALVEALGKQVLWDDRGLIVISDNAAEYTETEKVNIISLLSERVLLNGIEMQSFTTDKTQYTMLTDGNIPTVTLASGAPVYQNGNTASFAIGEKSYAMTFVADKFAGQIGTASDDNVSTMTLSVQHGDVPAVPDRQAVEHVTFSTGHDKYVEFGTLDNVISNELINRWSGSVPSWICYEFKAPVSLYAFGLAGMADSKGNPRSFIFNAEISMDGQTWEKVLDTKTSGTTIMPDIFLLNGKTAKFFRINGSGDANGGTFNSYSEVCFYTSKEQMDADMQYWPVYFAAGGASGKAGETQQLILKAMNSKGAEVAVSGVAYTSADPSVARVDANGLITFVGSGTTEVTASYEGPFSTVKATITVTCM